jgi:hypothetical protein
MELRHALAQVSEIREHLARIEIFRGYRSLTVGFTGVVGLITAAAQAAWLTQPTEHLAEYLMLWIGAAAVNVALVAIELWHRAHSVDACFARRTTVFAVGQLVPALVAGGLLTVVIARCASESSWMLPGLWAMLFSLGIFASCRLLPKAVTIAGAWYLFWSIFALAWGQGEAALSPWIMGITFGLGQLVTAVILHVTLERQESRQG